MDTFDDVNPAEVTTENTALRDRVMRSIGLDSLPEGNEDGTGKLVPEIDSSKEPVEIVLDHPVEFDGKRYERLTFNFIGIRRRQWKEIRLTFRGLCPNEYNPLPVDNEDYQDLVAAEAAKVPLLLISGDVLNPNDWKRINVATIQFLGKSLDPRLTRPK